jgi:hypothetical protein
MFELTPVTCDELTRIEGGYWDDPGCTPDPSQILTVKGHFPPTGPTTGPGGPSTGPTNPTPPVIRV